MLAAPLTGTPARCDGAAPAPRIHSSRGSPVQRCQPSQPQPEAGKRRGARAAAAATATPEKQVETVTGAPLEEASTTRRTRAARVPSFPFVRLAGQEEMKLALMLNVIDSRIGGVLIMGDRGTGKSVAVSNAVDALSFASPLQGRPPRPCLQLMGVPHRTDRAPHPSLGHARPAYTLPGSSRLERHV